MGIYLDPCQAVSISAPATSSLGHIPPPGVPANTCMAAHPGEGVGLECAMRIKTGTKRSNLDLTSKGQLKFNIYRCVSTHINLKRGPVFSNVTLDNSVQSPPSA